MALYVCAWIVQMIRKQRISLVVFFPILEGLPVGIIVGISIGCVAAVGAISGVIAALVIYVCRS